MVRKLPRPVPRGEIEFYEVTPEEEALALATPTPLERVEWARMWGEQLLQMWDRFEVFQNRRVFVVGCQGCPEIYTITAGPRGGGWKGKCQTCGRPAQQSATVKALMIEEVTRPQDVVEEQTHE